MSKIIDAVGKACPMPVVMAKKEMEEGSASFSVQVDNEIAVENLKKLAQSQGFVTQVSEEPGRFCIAFEKECGKCDPIPTINTTASYSIFIGKDYIGAGDETLGRSLMQMMLFTLTQSNDLPESILLMNAGVKLTAEDEQSIEHLKALSQKGIQILVCGTCLNYYGLTSRQKIGEVSNMYDILGRMQAAAKVITI